MENQENQPNTNTVPSSQIAPQPVSQSAPQTNRGGSFDSRDRRGGGGGRGRGRSKFGDADRKSEYEQTVLDIARVARVTKGGKRFSFRATIVIGDRKGKVGVGIAKGKDVAQSIQKAFNRAKKTLITIPLTKEGTIAYQVEAKYSSAKVILKPARGGVKAGGPVRVVAKLLGITSLTGKLLKRTNNKLNIAMATIEALKKIKPIKPSVK